MTEHFFKQNCRVCGRPMVVSSELLDVSIRCGHCGAVCDPTSDDRGSRKRDYGRVGTDPHSQIQRIDSLLRSAY